jgi:hypothetical protein
MRTLPAFIVAVVLAVPAFAQEAPKSKPPGKGDSVYVKGCLDGGVLESTETARWTDERTAPSMATLVTYRLTGSKDLLKQMKKEHDGELMEVTGILKSNLPGGDAPFEKTIGKTKVRIGVGPASPTPGPSQEAARSLPVLEVKSFEPLHSPCRR